jgi:cytochrome b6-f complex iron-sulfur subunit
MTEINRRQFVLGGGAALCACMAGCAAGGGAAAAPWTGPMTFDLPNPDKIANGIDTRWLETGGFFLVRDGGRIVAVTSTCSHKACALSPKFTEYVCPCHGSRFTPAGKVLVGPATTSLDHFGISLTPKGTLFVDRNKVFDEAAWNQPGAFVAV